MTDSKSPDLRKNRKVPKGTKAMRGRPLIYDELKERKWYTLTPSVILAIKKRAEAQGLTESEALERLIRVIEQLPLPKS
jgi:hypothetical protein